METKKYESWFSQSELSDAFFEAEDQNVRRDLPSDAQLRFVVEAASWNEAQQKRYDLMSWGQYKTTEEYEK